MLASRALRVARAKTSRWLTIGQGRVFAGQGRSFSAEARQSNRGSASTVFAVTALGAAALGATVTFASEFEAESAPTKLYSWGSDLYGQLGVGRGADVLEPTEAASSTPTDVVQIEAAGLTTGLLTSQGDFYTFGCGMHGRLGHGNSVANVTAPRRVEGIPSPCRAIAVGENHVAAVTMDGKLYTAGRQMHGNLGHNNSDKGRPAVVRGELEGKQVIDVACGTKHTLALTADGQVFAFGDGRTLALGQGTSKQNYKVPVLVDALSGKKVIEVHAGNGFSVALTEDGAVYSWGLNDLGQLGQGSSQRYAPVNKVRISEPVSKLSCGDFHVLAATRNGSTLYAFGSGEDGRTGLGNTENTTSPQEVTTLAGAEVTMIAAGGAHSMATTADAKIYTWGRGRNGQLGQGSKLSSVATARTTPVEVESVGKPRSIACGKDHSCLVVE